MNTKSLFAIATFATLATGFAQAGEFEPVNGAPFVSTRTRAEVRAEARQAPQVHEVAAVGAPQGPQLAGRDVRDVRAEAVMAVRLGQIPHGEGA